MSEHILEILLIEDNPADIAFIEEMLSETPGYTYILSCVDNLADGITMLKENSYSIVITDISLPDNDGLENIDKLKAVNESIPIILLTGLDNTETGRQAVIKGAQDFLTKGNINAGILSRSINYSIERKHIELELNGLNKTLKNIVQYDALTGLINRRPFIDQLENNIARAERNNEKIGVLFADIENFKHINDTYGHSTGDRVLQVSAINLKRSIRKSDFIGRLGGDEFVICLNNINYVSDAIKVAHNINNSFIAPIEIDGLKLNIGVSIGIAICPNDGNNASILLNNSDIAMYKSKREKRNSFHLFNIKLKQEQDYKHYLRHALAKNEFKVKYQAVFNNIKSPVFIEALLRWDTPIFNNKSSMDFIPLLEENKSIFKVGKWFVEQICKDINSLYSNSNFKNLPISINISQHQLKEEAFAKDLNNILQEYKISPKQFIIELTCKKHLVEIKKICDVMQKLKQTEINSILLDDFGTGYSPFSCLINLPIDMIKLDTSILFKSNTKKCYSMYSSLIKLLKDSEIKVIAKKIETEEQYTIMKEMECDFFQGYHLSLPQNNILDLVDEIYRLS